MWFWWVEYNADLRSTGISKSRQIEWWNHEYQLIIQVLHGSRKTFRSRITKNNLLNSRFTENKISQSRITGIPLYDPHSSLTSPHPSRSGGSGTQSSLVLRTFKLFQSMNISWKAICPEPATRRLFRGVKAITPGYVKEGTFKSSSGEFLQSNQVKRFRR